MSRYRVVGVREESPGEAAQREWLEKQVLASPDNLENAARLIITLVTGLLGTLFGVLTIASDKLPYYLKFQEPRWLGILAVVGWFVALSAALAVVFPRRIEVADSVEDEANKFKQLLRRKSLALRVSIYAFTTGLAALGTVIVVAFLFPYMP